MEKLTTPVIEKFWIDTVLAYTAAANSISVDRCIQWADDAVAALKERQRL